MTSRIHTDTTDTLPDRPVPVKEEPVEDFLNKLQHSLSQTDRSARDKSPKAVMPQPSATAWPPHPSQPNVHTYEGGSENGEVIEKRVSPPHALHNPPDEHGRAPVLALPARPTYLEQAAALLGPTPNRTTDHLSLVRHSDADHHMTDDSRADRLKVERLEKHDRNADLPRNIPSGPKTLAAPATRPATEYESPGHAMVELNNAAQKLGYRQAIDVYRKLGTQRWFGSVYIGRSRHDLRDAGASSPSAAKLKLVEFGMQKLADMPRAPHGMLEFFPKPSPIAPTGFERPSLPAAPEKIPHGKLVLRKFAALNVHLNFISLIFEWYNISSDATRPTWQIDHDSTHTTAVLMFSIRGQEHKFTARSKAASSLDPEGKTQAAKAEAAREAIEWLLSERILTRIDDDGHIRQSSGNKRPAPSSYSELPSKRQTIEPKQSLALVLKQSPELWKNDGPGQDLTRTALSPDKDDDTKYTRATARLAEALGHPKPVYYIMPSDPSRDPNGTWDCSAHLTGHVNESGVEGGAVAQLRSVRVDGPSAAHEAIAQKLYLWLNVQRQKKQDELAEQIKKLGQVAFLSP